MAIRSTCCVRWAICVRSLLSCSCVAAMARSICSHLGGRNRILLLVRVGLELFLDQFLRDAPGLRGQTTNLIGPRRGRMCHGDRSAGCEECGHDGESCGAGRHGCARSDLRFRPSAVHDPSNLAVFARAPSGQPPDRIP